MNNNINNYTRDINSIYIYNKKRKNNASEACDKKIYEA